MPALRPARWNSGSGTEGSNTIRLIRWSAPPCSNRSPRWGSVVITVLSLKLRVSLISLSCGTFQGWLLKLRTSIRPFDPLNTIDWPS